MSHARVSIDATPLLLRSAGVKNYLYYWIRSLLETAGARALHLFPFLRLPSSLRHDRSCETGWSTAWRLALLHAANISPFSLLDALRLPASLFHASHQLRHPPRKLLLTTTIYDFTCWHFPETHTPANVRASRWFAENVMRRAHALIAISEATRRDAINLLSLCPDRIQTIYPGVAPEFFHVSSADVEALRARYRITRPYVLFLGAIEPRKNLLTALDAWQSLPADFSTSFDFLIAGPLGWRHHELLARLQSPPAGVRYLGYIPECDLPSLTAGATVFLYPSLFEGFGLPVAQALACGVPVITSSVSSLPEVAGEGALFIEPRSVSQCRHALESLLSSPSLRARLSAAGRARAQRYQWSAAAAATWRFFERLLG